MPWVSSLPTITCFPLHYRSSPYAFVIVYLYVRAWERNAVAIMGARCLSLGLMSASGVHPSLHLLPLCSSLHPSLLFQFSLLFPFSSSSLLRTVPRCCWLLHDAANAETCSIERSGPIGSHNEDHDPSVLLLFHVHQSTAALSSDGLVASSYYYYIILYCGAIFSVFSHGLMSGFILSLGILMVDWCLSCYGLVCFALLFFPPQINSFHSAALIVCMFCLKCDDVHDCWVMRVNRRSLALT